MPPLKNGRVVQDALKPEIVYYDLIADITSKHSVLAPCPDKSKGQQEILADAKVSARQQCVYELKDPYRRNLQQICN